MYEGLFDKYDLYNLDADEVCPDDFEYNNKGNVIKVGR